MEEANKLINLGKKYLQDDDVMKAVDVLQEAAGMLARQFGEKADECGQAYYWYAVALLEQERMENRVLGNALAGICVEVEEEKSEDSITEGTEKLDEKTMDELRAQVYDAMAEREGETTAQKKDDAAAEEDEGKDDDVTEKKDPEKPEGDQSDAAEKDEQKSVKEENADEASGEKEEKKEAEDEAKETKDGEEEDEMEVEEQGGDKGEDTAEGQDEEDDDEKDSDDDVENLQLAWEMLELAKIIYKRKDTKEDQLMLSRVHLKLGEVSVESGNGEDAKEDFDECVTLQLKHLEPDSRLLAETYYNLGLLYTTISQHDEAAESLSCSIAIIDTRLEKLKKLMDGTTGPEDLPEERQEMKNLQSLLPDIKTKQEEAIHHAKMAKISRERRDEDSSSPTGVAKQNRESTAMVNGFSTDGQPAETQATDISHLVRKKRKPESPTQCVVKKVKQDEMSDDEPHSSGSQGQGNESQNNGSQGQGNEDQSNSSQGQSNETQNNETQSNGAQGQSNGPQSNGPQSNGPQGQSNGPQSNSPQSNGPQGQGNSPQSNSPQSNGPQSNGPQGQGNSPQSNGPQGQGNSPQSNGPEGQGSGICNGPEGQGSGICNGPQGQSETCNGSQGQSNESPSNESPSNESPSNEAHGQSNDTQSNEAHGQSNETQSNDTQSNEAHGQSNDTQSNETHEQSDNAEGEGN